MAKFQHGYHRKSLYKNKLQDSCILKKTLYYRFYHGIHLGKHGIQLEEYMYILVFLLRVSRFCKTLAGQT